MERRKRKLTYLLLLPLLLIVLLQGLLPFSILLASGTKATMARNAVDIDSNLVENRKVVLENAMVGQWSSVQGESAYLNSTLRTLLSSSGTDMDAFLNDETLQQEFTEQVFPELLSYLRLDSSSGLFLILGNGGDLGAEQDYVGFFLRDSDPTAKTDTNSDLLFERGRKTLARQSDIALDSSWSPAFHFMGEGVRSADDFFYTPYRAALENKDASMSDLGYWALPFILEDHPLDNHQMITYSVPLICGGTVYGVLGTEVSVSYLCSNYLPVRDLDRNQNAGYAIAIDGGDGTYRTVTGKGTLFSTVHQNGEVFSLEDTEYRELFQVAGSAVGDQKIYSTLSSLSLYGGKVPYENTDWVLCGFVTEKSVFGLGDQLYHSILSAIVLCVLVGMGVMQHIMTPIYRLMDSIRGGLKGLKAFRPSNILEIDELHQVVENLTENEISTEKQLMEEKERYRVALESSNDIFFTYREEQQIIEVVNSRQHDGIWSVNKLQSTADHILSAEDQGVCTAILHGTAAEIHEQVRLLIPSMPDGLWVEINGKAVRDPLSGSRTVVGYIRNIHEAKLRELEREKQQDLDPVTGFYRLVPGLNALYTARQQPEGQLILLDVCAFSHIVQNFGLTFGDVILNEFAEMTARHSRELSEEKAVLIRAGSDEFLVWLPGAGAEACDALLRALHGEFSRLIHGSALELNFRAGLAGAGNEPAGQLVRRVQAALSEAKRRGCGAVRWEEQRLSETAGKHFSEIVSQSFIDRMGLASLILNLFDRNASIVAALDLAACRLAKQFPLEDLLVTTFNGDYLSGAVEYCWKYPQVPEGAEPVYRCTEADYQMCSHAAQLHRLQPIGNWGDTSAIFASGLYTRTGIVYPMSDNNQYSGSIFFLGIDESILDDKDSHDLLWEVGTIIQNRINQEHHDQSAQAKSDFLARMSHEIRTPMNGIIGMTEIALREGQSEEVRIDCLKKVRSSSDYLLGLLNDILDMSKIESGKMTLAKDEFDLSRLLDELPPVLDGEFAKKKQRFLTDIRLTHRWFCGDALRISQILINLLGNAVKYSGENTEVKLTVTETAAKNGSARVSFSVADHGAGISEKDRQRIFGVFEQLDGASSHRQGSGLGLAICNRLVHMMNSEILLDSEPGKGSTFSFTLELPVVAAPQHKDEDACLTDADLAGVRVLVVEDNPLNMEIMRIFLSEMGCQVDGAENGAQAVERFAASSVGSYRIIFMDVMMPVMDGLEAAHRIRTLGRPDSGEVPIIAVSANAFDEDIKRSLASGMNAHLSKPIEPEKLKAVAQKFALHS